MADNTHVEARHTVPLHVNIDKHGAQFEASLVMWGAPKAPFSFYGLESWNPK